MINPDDNNLENEDQNDDNLIENLPVDPDNENQILDQNASDLDRLKQAIAASEPSFTLDIDKGFPSKPDSESKKSPEKDQ